MVIGLVRDLLFKNQGWCWRIVTSKVMGNQVCALGSQPGEVPLLFFCSGENKTSLRKWETNQFPPATRWPRDISGRIGVEKTVFGLVSWKLGDGEVSVSVVFDNAEVGGAGGGVKAGLKKNSSQTIFTSHSRSVNAYQISVQWAAPPPQLHTGTPKLSSQTDPALSSTITSTLRPNESTLYQEWHSFYDLHIRQIKAFLHYIMVVEWLLKMHYNMYVCASRTLFLSICFSKEGEQMSLTQSSFFLEIIQK